MVDLSEVVYALILLIWVIVVVRLISKKVYEIAKKKWDHDVGLYFARKTLHVLAGGLVALLIPLLNLFRTPILPLMLGIALAIICYVSHTTGKLMYWFQDTENVYEVDFCLLWAFCIALGWFISDVYRVIGGNKFWFGVVPVLFMAWGDGVTGIVRNFLFKKRAKHWSGNLAMFLLCAPIGYFSGFGVTGVLASIIASAVERIERIGNFRVDDNISVPISAFTVLTLFTALRIPVLSPP